MDNDGLTVLSLFDGMSCGAIALREAGIKVKQYFASEIDKAAIRQTAHNFPDTIQLGNVVNISAADLPPHRPSYRRFLRVRVQFRRQADEFQRPAKRAIL